MSGKQIMFGMWNIKGSAEPARWVFLHFGMNVKEWNPANLKEFEDMKKSLNLPHLTLPFVKDDDFILTETSAIGPYLAQRAGKPEFLGRDLKEKARILELDGIMHEIRLACVQITKLPKDADHRKAIEDLFAPGSPITLKIQYLSILLGQKEYFFDHLTWADYLMQFTARFCGAMTYSLLGRSPFAEYPNIVALMSRVTALKGIKERLDYAQVLPYLPQEGIPFKFMTFGELIQAGLNPI